MKGQQNTERTKKGEIRRFSAARVLEHWVHAATFAFLVVTGLSQKFFYLDVSQWVVDIAGGIDQTRMLHRYAGMVFSALVLMHIGSGMAGIMSGRWDASMMIVRQDFRDIIADIRYYVGSEADRAPCGRFSYKQKFVYWGVLSSAVVMMLTGLFLWFPIAVARFLPVEAIPLAKLMHSSQAFFVFIVIALWHGYQTVFSPDVFPFDTAMCTGLISRERMAREHPLELARIGAVPGRKTTVVSSRRKQVTNP